MRHNLIWFCLMAYILLMMPMTTVAQSFDADRLGSISITLMEQDGNTPIPGAELSLYHVANVNLNSRNNLSYNYTGAFRDCDILLDDPALSVKLDAFVEAQAAPVNKLLTDSQGHAEFGDLPLGLYFIKQTNAVSGYAPCTSFLVTVPNENTDGYVFDVNASPKTDVEKLTSITIKKIWNTDNFTKIADSVTVQLLCNNIVVKTATLNAGNNWQVTYTDMQESDGYSILEVNVPQGFTATYSRNGYVFTVTNSAALIQTGQLVWPIPVLAWMGLIFITMGTVVLRRARKNNG